MYQNFASFMNPMYMRSPLYPNPSIENIKLARAYVPDQPFTNLFPLEEALRKGTIFPNLAIPYAEKSKE